MLPVSKIVARDERPFLRPRQAATTLHTQLQDAAANIALASGYDRASKLQQQPGDRKRDQEAEREGDWVAGHAQRWRLGLIQLSSNSQ
jgi:hypothetical protein